MLLQAWSQAMHSRLAKTAATASGNVEVCICKGVNKVHEAGLIKVQLAV